LLILNSDSFSLLPAKVLSGRCRSKVDDSEIDPKIAYGVDRCAVRQFYTKAQVELPFAIDQISLFNDTPLFKFGVLTKNNGDHSPAVNSGNRSVREATEGKQSIVIDHSRMFFK